MPGWTINEVVHEPQQDDSPDESQVLRQHIEEGDESMLEIDSEEEEEIDEMA